MAGATGSHPARDLRGWLLAAALVWLGVVVLGVVAVRFAPDGSGLAAWWPATGLAVAFLVYSPARRRPDARSRRTARWRGRTSGAFSTINANLPMRSRHMNAQSRSRRSRQNRRMITSIA